ncbi:MAG: glycerophosphodiester phosphodiesterase family protein [Gammaproteobacteria bacterium]
MTTPWLFDEAPAVVAHRGYAGRYPENTVLALAAAVAYGARFLELDVQLTRDGVPVVCHDDTLQRCGNDPRRVLDHDWRDLRGASVGEPDRFGERYAHVALSTLADVAAHLRRWPETTCFVEIKEHSTKQFGVDNTVKRVLEALGDLQHPFVVLSFVDEVITQAKAQGAALTGWVVTDWNDDGQARLNALAPDYVYCNQDKIARDDALWPGPWHWVLYEVTKPEDAQRWRAAGAAMIESMHPPTFIT